MTYQSVHERVDQFCFFFFSSRRRHTRCSRDWSSDVCSSDLGEKVRDVGPATVMRESIEIIKGMLSGNEVKYQGKAFQAFAPALKSDARAPRWLPPIYVGATGPVLQRLAGAMTQGLLTASITTPKFARYSRKVMEDGAKKAGRDASQLDLGCVVIGSVGEDPRTAREGAREMAAMYLANKVQNIKGSADTLLECAGLTREEIEPIADAMEKGGRKAAARALSDSTLEKERARAAAL